MGVGLGLDGEDSFDDGDVFGGVDFPGAGGGHLGEYGGAEEAVLVLFEPFGAHDVDGAVFGIFGFNILSALAVGGIVVYAGCLLGVFP